MAGDRKKVKVAKNSVLRFAEFVDVEDAVLGRLQFWRPMRLPEFEADDTDVEYQVNEGDAVDDLARRFYGDERLQWVIQWANDITLPPVQIYGGRILRIPSRRRILDVLLRGG